MMVFVIGFARNTRARFKDTDLFNVFNRNHVSWGKAEGYGLTASAEKLISANGAGP